MTICSAWADESDLCAPCSDYEVALDPTLLDTCFTIATELLYAWSGRQYPGICTETVRPCSLTPPPQFPWSMRSPFPQAIYTAAQGWLPGCGCNLPDTCGCGGLRAFPLPRWPIRTVTSVLIDGATFTDFRVDEDQYLIRLDGQPWPCCQQLELPATEKNTWQISYTWGREVPATGRRAAAVLACEFYLLAQPDDIAKKCRLPRNAVRVSRQGTTVDLAAAANLLTTQSGKAIRLGITEIDTFLNAENPHGLDGPMEVFSPDITPYARRVDTHYATPPIGD